MDSHRCLEVHFSYLLSLNCFILSCPCQTSSFQHQVFKASKRRRVKRTSESGKQDSNADATVKDREIKIGTQKQNAIKHMCNYCTFESYRALQCHLSFFSESSVNESILSWKHLWATTLPADGMCPSEAEEYARRAGAAASAKLVPPRLMCLCCMICHHSHVFSYEVFMIHSKTVQGQSSWSLVENCHQQITT